MNTDRFGEDSADIVLRSAGNDQLESFQLIDLSPTLERIQKILVIVL